MSLKSSATLTAVALLAGLALTACSSSSSPGVTHTAAPGGSSTAASAGTGSSAPAGGSSGSTGSAGGSSQPSSPVGGGSTPVPAGGQACTSEQLSVAQGTENAGAGQMGFTITFTNNSDKPCTMDGYPGVSYEAPAGKPTGAPAARSGAAHHTVTLAAHGTAGAVFQDANGQSGYDSGTCQLTDATGLKIYPPGERTALFLPWKTKHCTGSGVHPATIGPVTEG